VDDRMHDAKHPRTVLAGPYGHPFHPIAVTVPIGAWVCALVFDVGALLLDQPSALLTGALWLIAVGVVGALIAAGLGVLDLMVIPRRTAAYRTAVLHMGLNLLVAAAFAGSFYFRTRGLIGTMADNQPWAVVSDVVLLAFLGVSGYLGGTLAYRYGIRVAAEGTQRTGFDPREETPVSSQPRTQGHRTAP